MLVVTKGGSDWAQPNGSSQPPFLGRAFPLELVGITASAWFGAEFPWPLKALAHHREFKQHI